MKEKIDYKEITRLIDLVEEKNLAEFELELEGFKIKISRKPSGIVVPEIMGPVSREDSAEEKPGYSEPEESAENGTLHFIRSPMVGTFYRAPDPTAPPFVDIGETVDPNQTICIVEAMKLMNEIESDIKGTVEEIYVKNGKPVEYGQKLFGLKPL
jgi:acetyl-CoA carboxylase biotin carboxyl carrier protein